MYEDLLKQFPNLRRDEPLSQHCTFRVGGPADLFFEWKEVDELAPLIEAAEQAKVPYRIIGRGTNILFTDKGYRGLIIKNMTSGLEVDGTTVKADSGVLWAQLLNQAIANGLGGIEPLHGLPGSIGAAVWGNAGVPNCETGDFVQEIELFNSKDGRRTLSAQDIKFEYRHTSLQELPDIILSVTLKLPEGDPEKSKALIKEVNAARIAKQPPGFTCGSFFKNPDPPKITAGRLIDEAGIKGTTIGGAQISEKHGNFFLNLGGATASDILELASLAQEKVKSAFNIDLEMEVKVIGEG